VATARTMAETAERAPERMPGETASKPPALTMREALALPVNDAHFVTSRDNQRFFALEPGNPDLRTAPRGTSDDTELPIRLRRGDMSHVAAPAHETDARILGYRDPLHLLIDVVQHCDVMHQASANRVLLASYGAGNAVAVVELGKFEGADYWRVVTVGRRRDAQLGIPLRVRERTPEAAIGGQPPF